MCVCVCLCACVRACARVVLFLFSVQIKNTLPHNSSKEISTSFGKTRVALARALGLWGQIRIETRSYVSSDIPVWECFPAEFCSATFLSLAIFLPGDLALVFWDFVLFSGSDLGLDAVLFLGSDLVLYASLFLRFVLVLDSVLFWGSDLVLDAILFWGLVLVLDSVLFWGSDLVLDAVLFLGSDLVLDALLLWGSGLVLDAVLFLGFDLLLDAVLFWGSCLIWDAVFLGDLSFSFLATADLGFFLLAPAFLVPAAETFLPDVLASSRAGFLATFLCFLVLLGLPALLVDFRPRRKDPEAPVPLTCLKTPVLMPDLSAILTQVLIFLVSLPTL